MQAELHRTFLDTVLKAVTPQGTGFSVRDVIGVLMGLKKETFTRDIRGADGPATISYPRWGENENTTIDSMERILFNPRRTFMTMEKRWWVTWRVKCSRGFLGRFDEQQGHVMLATSLWKVLKALPGPVAFQLQQAGEDFAFIKGITVTENDSIPSQEVKKPKKAPVSRGKKEGEAGGAVAEGAAAGGAAGSAGAEGTVVVPEAPVVMEGAPAPDRRGAMAALVNNFIEVFNANVRKGNKDGVEMFSAYDVIILLDGRVKTDGQWRQTDLKYGQKTFERMKVCPRSCVGKGGTVLHLVANGDNLSPFP